jgi:anaerobic C4-dicarboxylate transporter
MLERIQNQSKAMLEMSDERYAKMLQDQENEMYKQEIKMKQRMKRNNKFHVSLIIFLISACLFICFKLTNLLFALKYSF